MESGDWSVVIVGEQFPTWCADGLVTLRLLSRQIPTRLDLEVEEFGCILTVEELRTRFFSVDQMVLEHCRDILVIMEAFEIA